MKTKKVRDKIIVYLLMGFLISGFLGTGYQDSPSSFNIVALIAAAILGIIFFVVVFQPQHKRNWWFIIFARNNVPGTFFPFLAPYIKYYRSYGIFGSIDFFIGMCYTLDRKLIDVHKDILLGYLVTRRDRYILMISASDRIYVVTWVFKWRWESIEWRLTNWVSKCSG